MEREQILRDDFPTVRKGWDPAAVAAHLRQLADDRASANGSGPSLASVASERVAGVIDAAEEAAAAIERDAHAEAEATLADARSEADRLVAEARTEANERVEQARAAVEGLIAQASELSSRVGTLGEELAGNMRTAPAAEVPGPVIVPEPTPPTIPEPTPDPVPEPTPDPVPEPTPEPSPEPVPDPVPEPTPDPTPPGPDPDLPDAPEPAPPVPEPAPTPAANGAVSTDDLIAQLRAASEPANGAAAAELPGADLGAARLVAMNMTLDGASREQIEDELKSGFDGLPDVPGLVDEVFARAGR